MRWLVNCEESQAVCKELRARGQEAYSCDLLDCSGGRPEWHIKGDAIEQAYSGRYDVMVAFPPCTRLTVMGAARWYTTPGWLDEQKEALQFVRLLMAAPIEYIAIENPVGRINTAIRKPDQIIHPWMFGDPYTKRTCLWLKGLPLLIPTNPVTPVESWVLGKNANLHGDERRRVRSKTFPGIAQAMAAQWVAYLLTK